MGIRPRADGMPGIFVHGEVNSTWHIPESFC